MNCIKIDLAKDKFIMINKTTGKRYDNNTVIIDTDIRNGTRLVLM